VSASLDLEKSLSAEEQKDLVRHELLLDLGFKTMEKMAEALRDIQSRKLYRAQFRTFEGYVRTKWDMSIRRAYQLCSYGHVVENLRLHNCAEIPNESQARELAKLTPAEQPKVWAEATQSGEKPTAAVIAGKVEKISVRIIPPKRDPKHRYVSAVIDAEPQEAKAIQVDVQKVNAGYDALCRAWDAADCSAREAFLKRIRKEKSPDAIRGS
jgi:hypothetical protein